MQVSGKRRDDEDTCIRKDRPKLLDEKTLVYPCHWHSSELA